MPTCIFIEGWLNNALTNNWIVRNFIQRLLSKFGLANAHADRHPIRIFLLEHDLMPEHYGATESDDERTGYAIAAFLASRPDLQRAATIMVHSFNADGAMRMVEELRGGGRHAEYIPFHFLEDRIRNFWPR